MKKSFLLILAAISSVVFTNCASTYKPIRPEVLTYSNQSLDSSISFSYQYGTLRMLRNKKYAKREDRKGIRVVAVKITNHSAEPVTFNQNLKLYAGNNQVVPLDPAFVHQELKQGVAIYLLYAPLTLAKLTFYDTSTPGQIRATSSVPFGLVVGPGITIGNMAVAGNANQRFLNELTMYNLIGRQIKPGETVYGLVSIHDFGFNPLSVRTSEPGTTKSGF
jgi:hypothetical protein